MATPPSHPAETPRVDCLEGQRPRLTHFSTTGGAELLSGTIHARTTRCADSEIHDFGKPENAALLLEAGEGGVIGREAGGGLGFGVLDFGLVDAKSRAIGIEIGAVHGFEVDGHVFLEGEDFEAEVAGGELGGVAAEADFEGGAVVEIVVEQAAVESKAGDITGVADAEDGV